jgi:hypothetical protein
MDWSLKESHSLAVIMDKMGDPRTCSTLITDCNQASAGFLCFDYLLLQRILQNQKVSLFGGGDGSVNTELVHSKTFLR